MNRILSLILISIIVFYVGFGALLFSMQRNFIYFPTEPVKHGFDEMVFENDNETIKTILLNKGHDKAILYFGGNAETVAFTAFDFVDELTSYTIYLINYRGYGGSSGSPDESALFSDALTLYDSLSITHSDVFVIGRSLGSGVATYLAAERPVKKLVLITPFDSIQSIAQKQFPFYPMPILLKDKYNSVQFVANIHAATLMLVAENDNVVARIHTNNLVQAFVNIPPEVVIIKGAGHNDISQKKDYFQLLSSFFKSQ
ncbi:MAG: alpha/beta hydrolase [Colwellia sp.]|nr:alpha/beta hydrolase [Colwellia sp.]